MYDYHKLYCEACEGIFATREYENQEKQAIIRTKDQNERAANKEKKRINEEIEIEEFVNTELNRFNTPFGKAILNLSKKIIDLGENGYYMQADELQKAQRDAETKRRLEAKQAKKKSVKNKITNNGIIKIFIMNE